MMNTIIQPDLNTQRGAATLLTALVLLVCITLVTLTTSKTVLVETQIAADNYRMTQAVAVANYAMDYGVNYFDKGGFDQDGVAGIDSISVPNLVSADGNQTTTATLTFSNVAGNGCVPAGATATMKNGKITARGFSDDALASRTITQCVGPLNLLRDDGPDQPLVAQGQVAVTGNAHIINRYTNTTVWAGDKVQIGSSSSMETLIKDPASGVLTQAQLLDTDATHNTQLVSNKNLGNGLDIIDGDPNLNNLVGLDFFKNFFTVESREQLKQMAIAAGQYYTDISSAAGKSGLIWVEGDQHLTGGTYGSTAAPAIIIVNGDLQSSGNSTIYGLLYIAGKYDIGGTVTVVGANVVEGTNLATGLPATAPAVSGTGTLNLVYWQGFISGSSNLLPGFGTVISGSWRDW